jgi:orotidine-5'-phosphate decarboxylase
MTPDPRIIVALDYPEAAPALELAARLDASLCRLKVGKELFTAAGPDLVRRLVDAGHGVFLDLKFHDIPNTVAAACRAAANLGVWMLNVHTLGGGDMLRAARDAVSGSTSPPLLIGVTLLTSHAEATLHEVGMTGPLPDAVLRLAMLAHESGLDGVVCSAHEAGELKARLGTQFRLVTPGVRPAGSTRDDQQRVMTPLQAIRAGADYLVVGRPITRAADPQAALLSIHEELRS